MNCHECGKKLVKTKCVYYDNWLFCQPPSNCCTIFKLDQRYKSIREGTDLVSPRTSPRTNEQMKQSLEKKSPNPSPKPSPRSHLCTTIIYSPRSKELRCRSMEIPSV